MACGLPFIASRKEGNAHVDACVFPFTGSIRPGVQPVGPVRPAFGLSLDDNRSHSIRNRSRR